MFEYGNQKKMLEFDIHVSVHDPYFVLLFIEDRFVTIKSWLYAPEIREIVEYLYP